MVAGPIERATNLLPQFFRKRSFDYANAVDGMRQILWGLFTKIVIADNCAHFANEIFNNSADYGGSTLILGAILFSFQIYGDFSGYSDVAIGTARLFGFNLKQNFAFPYFSRDIAEFWRRWHISLSTWFRDYLYIPLGGSRGSTWMKVRNTFIIFIVSGFWHGANWTFIAWGILNAIYFLPILLMNRNRQNLDTVADEKLLPTFKELSSMLMTFGLTIMAWIFFRAENIGHAFNYISDLFLGLDDYQNYFRSVRFLSQMGYPLLIILVSYFLIEWFGRKGNHAIELLPNKWPHWLRHLFYYTVLLCIFWFHGQEQQFIYFQF